MKKVAMSSPPSRRSNESSFRIKLTRSEVVGIFRMKAAMFGLDARIALAIFGALSVISGAALYSAIQQSRVVALVTELEEVGKAYQAFILDTGVEPTLYNSRYFNSRDLIESSVNGWKGPYVSYSPDGIITQYLDHPKYLSVGIYKISTGGTNRGVDTDGKECTVDICDVYAYVNGVDEDIAKAVDVYVDGESGYNKGKILLGSGFTGGSAVANYGVAYKIGPSINRPSS